MPIFYQQVINPHTRLGVWKIEEDENFFRQKVPLLLPVTHPHKRLQHLAGRYLLQHLFPQFPYEEILIADTRKPYLPQAQFHFSISHGGDYAAAIVSDKERVGIDIEYFSPKTEWVKHKFLNAEELALVNNQWANIHTFPATAPPQPATINPQLYTLFWCCKEAVYKWWGLGSIDFRRDIHIQQVHSNRQQVQVLFTKQLHQTLLLQYILMKELCLTWTATR